MSEAAGPGGSGAREALPEESSREAAQRILEKYDKHRTGRLPRDLLRKALLEGLRPMVRPGGATEQALEQFVDGALDRFPAQDSRGVKYGPLADWLLDRDEGREGKLTLNAALAKAKELREERRSSALLRGASARVLRPALSGSTACEDEDRWSFERWLSDSAAPVVADALRSPTRNGDLSPG